VITDPISYVFKKSLTFGIRTFDLFKRTGVETGPYYISGRNTPSMYNDIVKVNPTGFDPFKVSKENGGPVPDK
jgi:hypothetical protein